MRRLSAAAARRVTVAAHGLDRATRPRPDVVGTRHLQRVVDTLGIVQIDSVNVLVRSHYLPFFSRLGPYDLALLDRMRDRAPRRLVEYWAHEAALIAPGTWPWFAFRMATADERAWSGMRHVAREQPELLEAVRAEVRAGAPRTARAIETALEHDRPATRERWGWNWSTTKAALEYLFWAGEISSAGRTPQFERRYAALEAVAPPAHRAAWLGAASGRGPSAPTAAESAVHLVRLAARAHGVASLGCLADYSRIPRALAAGAVETLVGAGELEPVEVAGWGPAVLDVRARRPRAVDGRALLSPFDPFVWTRPRIEALFGFRYRLEIYVPQAQRVHGYYVLPFLLGDALVGRVDLKTDRAAGALRVQQVTWQPGRGGPADAAALDDELDAMSRWLIG